MPDSTLKTSYNGRPSAALSQRNISKAAMDGALSKISTGESLLSEGSKLKARVVDFLGKELTLRLSDGSILKAGTAQGTPLSIGQMAEFEVIHSNSEQLLLKLINNGSQSSGSSVAGRALVAAGLPINEDNLALVNTLLENRLPVDAESIQLLSRQANAFKGTEITTLAQMNKYNIPVNRANINQFNAYMNYEHALLPGLQSLADSLDALGITELINFTEAAPEDAPNAAETDLAGPVQANSSNSAPENSSAAVRTDLSNAAQADPSNTAGPSGSVNSPSAGLQTPDSSAVAGQAESGTQTESTVLVNSTSENTAATSSITESNGLKAGNEAAALQNNLKITTTLSGGISITGKSPLKPSESPENPESTSNSQTFLSSEPDEPLLSAADLLKRWSVSPEKIKNKGELEKVAERLSRDLEKIEESIKKMKEQPGNEDTAKLLAKAEEGAHTLRDNLSFMNMLNRFFPYIQLPVRLDNKYAQGELFVYSRKNIKKTDGNASVLLHLDMENLGPTDIHLSLSGSTLAAKFYLADDTIGELFGKHLPELTERLEAQGLTVNCELLPREEADKPLHSFLATEENVAMKRYRFDCRA